MIKTKIKPGREFSINSFNELLTVCNEKKEIKLKYELEKNVNLVSFEKYSFDYDEFLMSYRA